MKFSQKYKQYINKEFPERTGHVVSFQKRIVTADSIHKLTIGKGGVRKR